MILPADRTIAVTLILEAVTAGAMEEKACRIMGISQRTLFRWKKRPEDQRPHAKRPVPQNKLTREEKQVILVHMNSDRFKSQPPSQMVPQLADEGIYLASESTIYRILKEVKQQNHRGRSEKPIKRMATTHCATGPNQVWMWDITWLKGPISGQFFYLYLILDLYSRKIVGWEIWPVESAEHASTLMRKTCLSEKHTGQAPLVLHSDNGSPMKGATLLETLYQLGITGSRSRPRVSNDNAYAESIFRTCKYRPDYPYKGFLDISEARQWVLKFTHWYNYEHHHSGLNFLTPNQRHTGMDAVIFQNRQRVYEQAKEKNPNRWTRQCRKWELDAKVFLNPVKTEEQDLMDISTA
jgi:putative transposase